MKLSPLKRSIMAAVCIALGLVLPTAFHAIPNAGAIYLPMQLPILVCGLAVGWSYGLVAGLVTPFLSSQFTGMPPGAALPGMMVELAVYGLVSGLMMRFIRTGKTYPDIYVSLIFAKLAGVIAAGTAKALIFSPGSYTAAAWAAGFFIPALPGIIIQLVFVPAVVYTLMKARLIPVRYQRKPV